MIAPATHPSPPTVQHLADRFLDKNFNFHRIHVLENEQVAT